MNEVVPKQYRWLYSENGPPLLVEALSHYGEKEVSGYKNNPKIIEWARFVGQKLGIVVKDDETPWCGTFMAYCAKVCGLTPPDIAVRASSWKDFGVPETKATLGDVLVFTRTGGGHVGIYVGEDELCYHVLGGNQGDAVSIVRIQKIRCTAIRRPEYFIPYFGRKVFLTASGVISSNEA